MAKLTGKKRLFVKHYLIDPNATKAAIAAGYSAKTAGQAGSRLLKDVQVQAELNTQTAHHAETLGLTADYVLDGIRQTIERCKLRFPNAALKGYELLGKHLKLFTEKVDVEHSGGIVLRHSVPRPERETDNA